MEADHIDWIFKIFSNHPQLRAISPLLRVRVDAILSHMSLSRG